MKHPENLKGLTYLRMALALDRPTSKEIARLANVSPQAVRQACALAEVDIQAVRHKKADNAFAEAVRSLQVNTRGYRPTELARMAGYTSYDRAELALQAAGIPYQAQRKGGPMSELVRFALTLHDTSQLTGRQIAELAGIEHPTPGQTLKRHGIPFREISPGKHERRSHKTNTTIQRGQPLL